MCVCVKQLANAKYDLMSGDAMQVSLPFAEHSGMVGIEHQLLYTAQVLPLSQRIRIETIG